MNESDSKTKTRRPVLAVSTFIVHEGKVLLVQRGRSPRAGLWSPPGGKVEFGETLFEAAKREVMEETGLAIEIDCFVTALEIIRDRLPTPIHYVLFVHKGHLIDATNVIPIAGDDASDARWYDLDALPIASMTEGTADLIHSAYADD